MPEKVRLHIGLGASFGLEGAAKATLKEDQNNTSNVMDTTKGLGSGAKLLGGYKFFFTERMGIRRYASADYYMLSFARRDYKLGNSYQYDSNLGKLSGLLDINLLTF